MWGEPPDQEGGRPVGDVEQHMVQSLPLHLPVDHPRHHVAGRQRSLGVVLPHELPARGIAEDAALAPDRLGDQEGLGPGMVEAGGMELDEFHVGDLGSGPPGHGHPVPGGDVGVGGVEVDLAAAPGGQRHLPGGEGARPAAAGVERVHAQAAVGTVAAQGACGDQVDRQVVLVDVDGGIAGHGPQQDALQLPAGDIPGVEDAPAGVPPLPAQVPPAPLPAGAGLLAELHPQIHQPPDLGWASGQDGLHHLAVAEPHPGPAGVLDVPADRVVLPGYRGDPPLGVVGAGLGPVLLGEDGHPAQPGRLEREVEARAIPLPRTRKE